MKSVLHYLMTVPVCTEDGEFQIALISFMLEMVCLAFLCRTLLVFLRV